MFDSTNNVRRPFSTLFRAVSNTDLHTRLALTAIAVFLGVLALRPVASPAPVQAQSSNSSLYIEPGYIDVRQPDGSSLGSGKMVVDLSTGDVWGFPTGLAGAPYPIDTNSSKPPVSKGVYLGRFDFPGVKRP